MPGTVFISSVVHDFSRPRDAAAQGIAGAGYAPRRSEDFGALDQAPQLACLQGVRDCDMTLMLLSATYGQQQQSGLSATHEEFREAMRLLKPVLVFIQEGISPEGRQAEFIKEVRDYLSGRVTGSFSQTDDLKVAITRALLHREQGLETQRADPGELEARAKSYITPTNVAGSPSLLLIVAAGPKATVVRPTQLNGDQLARDLMQLGMFGNSPVLTAGEQTSTQAKAGTLALMQRESSVLLDEYGTIRVALPATSASVGLPSGRLPSVIHEDVEEKLRRALAFSLAALDSIDLERRLTDLFVVAAVDRAGYLPWRTRAEAAASPNSATLNPQQPQTVVVVTPAAPRARVAVRLDANEIADDLAALLARAMK